MPQHSTAPTEDMNLFPTRFWTAQNYLYLQFHGIQSPLLPLREAGTCKHMTHTK